MRLNKFISDTGHCSRREADQLIDSGRVTVNGRPAALGTQVQEGDRVCIDGRALSARPPTVYLAFHKPVGVVCTTDQRDPDNIVDFIGYPERIFPIGRLDKDSEGLILLTNDGDIVNPILRAENHHEKEYVVTVDRAITPDFLSGMAGGVPILGTMTRRCSVRPVSRQAFRIILTQGMNRQIRRMCEHFGYEVTRLVRTRIMHITLGSLKRGHYRHLTQEEVAGLSSGKTAAASSAHPREGASRTPRKPLGARPHGGGRQRS